MMSHFTDLDIGTKEFPLNQFKPEISKLINIENKMEIEKFSNNTNNNIMFPKLGEVLWRHAKQKIQHLCHLKQSPRKMLKHYQNICLQVGFIQHSKKIQQQCAFWFSWSRKNYTDNVTANAISNNDDLETLFATIDECYEQEK